MEKREPFTVAELIAELQRVPLRTAVVSLDVDWYCPRCIQHGTTPKWRRSPVVVGVCGARMQSVTMVCPECMGRSEFRIGAAIGELVGFEYGAKEVVSDGAKE